jgi:hypothetical protein
VLWHPNSSTYSFCTYSPNCRCQPWSLQMDLGSDCNNNKLHVNIKVLLEVRFRLNSKHFQTRNKISMTRMIFPGIKFTGNRNKLK